MQVAPEQSERFDLVLAGGRILDERNGVDVMADLGIRGGRVAEIGPDLARRRNRTIDIGGALVSQG